MKAATVLVALFSAVAMGQATFNATSVTSAFAACTSSGAAAITTTCATSDSSCASSTSSASRSAASSCFNNLFSTFSA